MGLAYNNTTGRAAPDTRHNTSVAFYLAWKYRWLEGTSFVCACYPKNFIHVLLKISNM